MNDDATQTGSNQDPFAAIQSTEGSAEKSIEKEMHKNAEALAQAKLEREEALNAYEEELKTEGVGQLKEVKMKAIAKMEDDLSGARSKAETLKNNAEVKMKEAVQLITDAFNTASKAS